MTSQSMSERQEILKFIYQIDRSNMFVIFKETATPMLF